MLELLPEVGVLDGHDWLPSDALRTLHADIYGLVLAGDPTPFKAFRGTSIARWCAAWGTCPTTRHWRSGWWKRCA